TPWAASACELIHVNVSRRQCLYIDPGDVVAERQEDREYSHMEAIRIIVNEHRALAAVLHGMLYLVHEIRDHDDKPDFNLFGAMIYYIDSFPERFHHPKEDQYLYRLLRMRHPQAAPLLDRLEAEHRVGAEK